MKRLGKFEIWFADTCEAVEPVGLTLFKINVFLDNLQENLECICSKVRNIVHLTVLKIDSLS